MRVNRPGLDFGEVFAGCAVLLLSSGWLVAGGFADDETLEDADASGLAVATACAGCFASAPCFASVSFRSAGDADAVALLSSARFVEGASPVLPPEDWSSGWGCKGSPFTTALKVRFIQ